MNISDQQVLRRINKRIEEYSVKALSDAELLALLLQEGNEVRNVLALSNVLLEKFGTLAELCAQDANSLQNCALHLNSAQAVRLTAVSELTRRLRQRRHLGSTIYTGDDVYELFAEEMSELPQEHLRALLLDNRHRLMSVENISIGTLNSAPVHARDVFRAAVARNAQSVLLLHNHPSGCAEPSPNDIASTKNLMEAGRLLGIAVLDHIILGEGCFYSYMDGRVIVKSSCVDKEAQCV